VHEDGTFDLSGKFADYPVDIHGITSKSEWKQVCQTLSSYISADSIPSDHSGKTDENGTVTFTEIDVGMYLTLSRRVESGDKIVIFESFLTVLPGGTDTDKHVYDVTAKPKSDVFTPVDKEIEYTVVKHWRDNGSSGLRPDKIDVDIFKNGQKVSSQELSPLNNWSYSWTAKDDGAVWIAVERNVSDKYTVTSVPYGSTLVLTNSLVFDDPEAPPMGVETNFWPYILMMFISGGILIAFAIKLKRST